MSEMNRREFLGRSAALAGALFLANCGGTPESPKVYGVDVETWYKFSPEERGNHVWKFLTTPVSDARKEADRKYLLDAVNWVIESAERKGTIEHTVLHQALDGALKKNYAIFILHYRQRGAHIYRDQDAATEQILQDRKHITSSAAFLSSASRVTRQNVTEVRVNYHHSSSNGTTYSSRVATR